LQERRKDFNEKQTFVHDNIAYSFLFVIPCEASCDDIREYVGGGGDRIIFLVDDVTRRDIVVESDAEGYITHRCGTTLSDGQIR
jgi:hypothetical protein